MSVFQERARVAAYTRSRPADDPDLLDARRSLAAERLAAYIERTVNSAPPFTSEQRDRLALLLSARALVTPNNHNARSRSRAREDRVIA